jgi:hypothetical protein
MIYDEPCGVDSGQWGPPVSGCCDLPAGSEALAAELLPIAAHLMWARTGRRYGLCEQAIRPCHRRDCACDECACRTLSTVILPGPVDSVLEVTIDGVPLAPSDYRLVDHRRLVRADGAEWPVCDDLSLPPTEPGTWQITAMFGMPVPSILRFATSELLCELVKACTGGLCALPRSVTQVTRQGVSINFGEAGAILEQGRTGLYWVDQAISVLNPARLQSASRVHNLDRLSHHLDD